MEWDPTQFFRNDKPPPAFALVVLNQPINETALLVLRKHAQITICADGGANRFYDWTKAQNREDIDLPTLIIGDLDSINPIIKTHYASLGVHIIHDDDQYSTDFTKSLRYIRSHVRGGRNLDILILGGLGGRVDQAFSQINHLYSMRGDGDGDGDGGNMYLVSEESITFILPPGRNVIFTPGTRRADLGGSSSSDDDDAAAAAAGEEGYLLEENVGIIPLSGSARITTKGFQWDVEDWQTQIGGQLSTSNHIRAEVLQIETGVPVLFTVELAERLKRGGRSS